MAQTTRSAPLTKQEAGLAAILLAAGFFFPLADIKAVRVADGLPVASLGLEAGWGSLGILFIVFATAIAVFHAPLRKFLVYVLAGVPFFLLAALTSASQQAAGSARLGLGLAPFLWLMAAVVPHWSRPLTRLQKVSFAVSALAGVLFACWDGLWLKLGIVLEAQRWGSRIGQEVLAHLSLSLGTVAAAIIVGLPFAIVFSRRFRAPADALVGISQTIPSLALFGLLMIPLSALSQAFPWLRDIGVRGIGNTPAFLALALYALYPIVRNAWAALDHTPAAALDAAVGMGFSPMQMWLRVRLPLAAPLVMTGVRLALVQTIGNAVLAKLVGGGGLGVLVFEGLNQAAPDLILLGLLLIVALTWGTDRAARLLLRHLTPVPLRMEA